MELYIDKGYISESKKESEAFFEKPDFIHFIGMLGPRRPGVLLFATKLEYEHYKPGTAANDKYHIRMYAWNNIQWMIISIPKLDISFAEKKAQESELRIVEGFPTILGKGIAESFPIQGSNIRTLENVSSSTVYSGKYKEIIANEDKELELIRKRFELGML